MYLPGELYRQGIQSFHIYSYSLEIVLATNKNTRLKVNHAGSLRHKNIFTIHNTSFADVLE